MKPELQAVLDALLAESKDSAEVSLDALGEALGTHAISTDDVDEIMHALEDAGRKVIGPEGGGGEDRLKIVVTTARALVGELGRKPSVAEIAKRSGLGEDDVRHALALAKVMQR
jgi:hypothetical protein